MQKTVCLDLDGVLAKYDGWKGEVAIGDPLPGAAEFVAAVREAGFRPVIHTTREPLYVKQWLLHHGIAAEVSDIKPPAIAYVDDRAVRFDGTFDGLLDAVQAKTWWER